MESMNNRCGSNVPAFTRKPSKARHDADPPGPSHTWIRTKLSIQSSATSAAAVPSGSHSPHRYAPAASTKKKKKKKGVLGAAAPAPARRVSHGPPRDAGAASTKKKKRKKGVLGPSAKIEINAGHATSPAWTRRRKPEVDSCLRRNSIMIRMPFAK